MKKIRCRSAAAGGSGHSTSFARFCAVFQEIVKRSGVNWQRLVAVNSRRLPGFPPRCARTSPDRTWSVGSARPRSRAIPPTPRPRGRLSVLAFCGVARGAEVPRVRSRADYDGGARRGAHLTRLLAGRERRCQPPRSRRAGSHGSSARRLAVPSGRRVRKPPTGDGVSSAEGLGGSDPAFCAVVRGRSQKPPRRERLHLPRRGRRATSQRVESRGSSLRSSRRARGACVPAGSRRRAWRRHARGVWARQAGWMAGSEKCAGSTCSVQCRAERTHSFGHPAPPRSGGAARLSRELPAISDTTDTGDSAVVAWARAPA